MKTRKITRRERIIIVLLVNGASNKDMAAHLNRSLRLIEKLRHEIMKKLQARSPAHLGYLVGCLSPGDKTRLQDTSQAVVEINFPEVPVDASQKGPN